MTKPLIEIALKLTGQVIFPKDVTEIVKLVPTKCWHVGEFVQGTLLQRKDSGWSYGLAPRETYDMDQMLSELLDALEPRLMEILNAMRQYNLKSEFSFGVFLSDESPSSYFPKETMRRLCAFQASFDIDFILTE